MIQTLLAGAVLVALLAACQASPPTEAPSIRGIVTSIDVSSDGTGTMLVEGQTEQDTLYDRASVRLTTDTRFFASDGARIKADAVSVDDEVECWFTGPVAESYPVQATASDVRVVSE